MVLKDTYLLTQKKMAGAMIVEDPITGKEVVSCSGCDSIVQKRIRSYTLEQQIEILKTEDLPIFPLGDTIFIVDTINFFSECLESVVSNHVFQIVRKCKGKKSNRNDVFLKAVGIRGNNLIISLSFYGSDLLDNYYMRLNGDDISLFKNLVASTKVQFE